MDNGLPPPVARFDAPGAIAYLSARTGIAFELIGPAAGGEVGAAFVRWPDGHEGVLSRGAGDLAALRLTADILAHARRQGIPCPRYELIEELGDDIVIVQERLPGGPPMIVDDRLVERMIALMPRFSGLLADRPDVPLLDLYLDRSGPGFCLHESLERHDNRTRRLLAWVREIGRDPDTAMGGNDLVHADFHPGNVLVDESGDITGVVDWDAIGRGDRRFGLVTLHFDIGWRLARRSAGEAATTRSMELIEHELQFLSPTHLRAFRAHMSLRLVDWAIRHHPAEVVDHYLTFAEPWID
jgi:Ser/Thr protein kinase RdoA (MazF antagonist)